MKRVDPVLFKSMKTQLITTMIHTLIDSQQYVNSYCRLVTCLNIERNKTNTVVIDYNHKSYINIQKTHTQVDVIQRLLYYIITYIIYIVGLEGFVLGSRNGLRGGRVGRVGGEE